MVTDADIIDAEEALDCFSDHVPVIIDRDDSLWVPVAYEANYHQRVAARHSEMSREWLYEGEVEDSLRAQQLAASRYAAARHCVDMLLGWDR